MVIARLRRGIRIREFLPGALSLAAVESFRRKTPIPRPAVRADGSAVSSNLDLLDADGFCKSDDEPPPSRVPRQSQIHPDIDGKCHRPVYRSHSQSGPARVEPGLGLAF